jgi:hypothetical protein
MALHDPQGEVNGALLEDGTVLRLSPPSAMNFATLLQSGQTIVTEGTEWSSALGRVMEVRQIGPSREQLNWVAGEPGPRGKQRRRPSAWAAVTTLPNLQIAAPAAR